MPQIKICQSAIEKIMNDPKYSDLSNCPSSRAIPVLLYYSRSYSAISYRDAIEYGDGFVLSFMSWDEIGKARISEHQTVSIYDGVDIVVCGTKESFSSSFCISWSNNKFTLEREP